MINYKKLLITISIISLLALTGCGDDNLKTQYQQDYLDSIPKLEPICKEYGLKSLVVYSTDGEHFRGICYHDSPTQFREVWLT